MLTRADDTTTPFKFPFDIWVVSLSVIAAVTHSSSTPPSAALCTQALTLFSPLLGVHRVSDELQSAWSAAVLVNPVPAVITECLEGRWRSPPYGFAEQTSHTRTLKRRHRHISVIMLHIFSCLFFSLRKFFRCILGNLAAFLHSFHKCFVFFSPSLSPKWPLWNCTWWNAIKQRINLPAVQSTGSPPGKGCDACEMWAEQTCGLLSASSACLLSHEAFWAKPRRGCWETATAAIRRDEDTGCFG